jgi:beta-carotene 3-hydroxylase
MNPNQYLLGIGIGIAVYGFCYFMFHDVYVHQRLKVLSGFSNRYLRATVKAHKEHHNPNAHYNYGFLVAPFRYYREAFKK